LRITDDSLREAFAKYGELILAIVIRDPLTGQSRGFGAVDYSKAEESKAAIAAMNGTELDGKKINVHFEGS